jgi:type I restriction enzyme R subunit
MPPTGFSENTVEDAALAWLKDLGYSILHGPDIAPGEKGAERESYEVPFLPERLRQALARLNPKLSADALDEGFRKITRSSLPSLVAQNHAFHRLLVDGLAVEYRTRSGEIRWEQLRLIDFDDPEANEWIAVNQFTVTDGQHKRRPDVNGRAVRSLAHDQRR